MMSKTPLGLTEARRTEILKGLADLASDADGNRWDAASHYLPVPLHEKVGNPDIWLVVGARGMGKTTLFRTVVDGRELAVLASPLFAHGKTVPLEGWSGTAQIPLPDAALADEPRGYWLRRLFDVLKTVARYHQLPFDSRLSTRRPLTAEDRDALLTQIFDWDRLLFKRDFRCVVVYDALEKLPRWEAFAAGLVAFWADLAPRLRACSPKIFLREDVRDRLAGTGADFAKLGARTLTLTWSTHDIYRLLAFAFANSSKTARTYLETEGPFKFSAPTDGRKSWLPASMFPSEGPGSEERLATLLAGKWMGAAAQKGLTWKWIPRMLADANGAIAPRTVINLLSGAAAACQGAPQTEGALFSPEHLRQGLRKAARHRADELAEERADIVRLLERMKGGFVPIEGADLALRLFVTEGKVLLGSGEEASDVLHELERLGVLLRRADGRYDVPDLYRLGFEIKRRGGTPVLARRS